MHRGGPRLFCFPSSLLPVTLEKIPPAPETTGGDAFFAFPKMLRNGRCLGISKIFIIKSDMSEGIQTNNSRRKIRVSVCLGLSLAQLKLHRGIISHVADGSSVGGRSLALL